MAKRIHGRELNSDEVKEILELKADDITGSKLKELFAARMDRPAKFQPNDYFTLPAHKYFNKETIKTTAGRYVYNIKCMPEVYLKKYGYMNEALSTDKVENLEKNIGAMLLAEEMTTKEYAYWLDNSEWISMSVAYFISPSISAALTISNKDVMKRKDELFTEYAKELADGDINATKKVESELVDLAKQKIEPLDDASYDYFKSKNLGFATNYKKCSIMIGATTDLNTGKLKILKSNYIDGVTADEYGDTSSLTISGAYSRGVATQIYGYESKKYNNALNQVILDFDTEDCGTSKYLELTLTEAIKPLFQYRFIIDGSKLVELTPDVIDKYVGKTIKLRSPMYCKNDHICVHCAGTLYKRIGLKNVGCVISNATGALLNLSLKKMHDSSVKVNKLNMDEYITEH